MVEFVFYLLDSLIAERTQVAAFGEVLAQQAVEVFVAAALPRRVGIREVASCAQNDVDDVDDDVSGELAAIVPSERVNALPDGIQRIDDGFNGARRFTVRDTPQTYEAGLALHQRDDAGVAVADDGVAFPVTHARAQVHPRRPLDNAPTAKTLALPGRSASASASLAAA